MGLLCRHLLIVPGALQELQGLTRQLQRDLRTMDRPASTDPTDLAHYFAGLREAIAAHSRCLALSEATAALPTVGVPPQLLEQADVALEAADSTQVCAWPHAHGPWFMGLVVRQHKPTGVEAWAHSALHLPAPMHVSASAWQCSSLCSSLFTACFCVFNTFWWLHHSVMSSVSQAFRAVHSQHN